jgi:hypothetical protein
MQAKFVDKYKQGLAEDFEEYVPLFPDLPSGGALYSKVIYIHAKTTTMDVDNMSKPLVDAFIGTIYTDDNIINHRVCSKISFNDLDACELNLSKLPSEVAEKFSELISAKSEHILYYEVGHFTGSMVCIGGAENEA